MYQAMVVDLRELLELQSLDYSLTQIIDELKGIIQELLDIMKNMQIPRRRLRDIHLLANNTIVFEYFE